MRGKIRQHIKLFPVMKSHYAREKSKSRKYLSSLLSIAEMYRLFVKQYQSDLEASRVKYSYYAKVFNTEFNLSFGSMKTDTCPACEIFRNKLAFAGDEAGKKKIQ